MTQPAKEPAGREQDIPASSLNSARESLRVEHSLATESASQALARTTLEPTVQAAFTLESWDLLGKLAEKRSVNDLVGALQAQSQSVVKGDLGRLEAMLTTQAHVLDAMFNDMARRAVLNRADYFEAFERFMRLAFKAQSQCRATIETLAEIKNPKPVAFVQQANIASGPQQVNNGVSRPVRAGAHTGAGNLNSPNELLEEGLGNRLEHGTQIPTGLGNSTLEAMGEVIGAKVGAGQGSGGQE